MTPSSHGRGALRRRLSAGCGGALLAGVLIAGQAPAPPSVAARYAEAAESLRTAGLRSETAYSLLARLTAGGPRLTGSTGAGAAVELTRAMMAELGFETWLEPIMVQHWVRGAETAAVVKPGGAGLSSLRITALGNSVPTPEAGIAAPIVEIRSFDELRARGPAVKGKIVFFNVPMDPRPMDTFQGYGAAVPYRSQGASEAARAGAAAVLVRSVTLRTDDFPHAGMVAYDPDLPRIPAAAVSTRGADALSALLAKGGPVEVKLVLGCRELGPTPSANVVGQIRGSEKPDEIVVLGGHLDSWDLGTGAHDDGAGCIQAIEALRLIKELDPKPRRTVRAVMYMNEEFGASGGRDYAAAPRRAGERHIAALESDRGAFLPVGFGLGGTPQQFARLRTWAEPLLAPSGILWVRPGGAGADTGPLAAAGAVLMAFIPDSQKYFDVHHSGLDVLASVHPRELELGAITMAIMAYVAAQEGI
jgi:carboxypeptidase Q